MNTITIQEIESTKYKILNNGIFSISHNKIIKPWISKKGYSKVSLRINGKKYHFSVHRLVALKYIDNQLNKPEVNHIDGNKNNNDYSNLEWSTRLENIKHSWVMGLSKPKTNTGKSVVDNISGVVYKSAKDAASAIGINYYTLLGKLNGWIKTNETSLRYA